MQVLFCNACAGRSLFRRLLLVVLLSIFGASLANAGSMTFRMVNLGEGVNCGDVCGRVIVAEGEIDDSTAEAFVDFVQINGDRAGRRIVLLHSPGGRVVASMRLGEMFRLVGAVVAVARIDRQGVAEGRCYSACVYAFMGARKRVIPSGSKVGVHRMFMYERFGSSNDGEALSRTFAHQGMLDRLTAHARKMGVSPELIHKAERVAPEHMHVVSSKEMRRWRLAVEKL